MYEVIKKNNVISDKQMKEIIIDVLDNVSRTLSLSLGPYGSTTIIQDSQLGHYMTKDGFTILKNIKFGDPVYNTILQILNDISIQLVMKVGDGSTTSIVASNYLYKELNEFMNNHPNIRTKELINILNNCTKLMITDLKRLAKPVSEDLHELNDIAAISLNNDFEMGELVASAFRKVGKDAYVNIKLANDSKSRVDLIKGFQIDYGYIDPILMNNFNTYECKLEDVDILIFDKILEGDYYENKINNVLTEYSAKGKSLLIIAPGYSQQLLHNFRTYFTYLKDSKVKNKIGIIHYSNGTKFNRDIMYDLSIKVGAKMIRNSTEKSITPEVENVMYGHAKKINIGNSKTTFIDSYGHENEIKDRLSMIESEIETINLLKGTENNSVKLFELNKRKALLSDSMAEIYVGGATENERITTRFLVEDAVSACKSAIKYGYVLGCNISIPYVINSFLNNLDEYIDEDVKTIMKLMSSAFKNVFKTVCHNKQSMSEGEIEMRFNKSKSDYSIYDLVNDKIITIDSKENLIINSVETEIEILKNVISIITLLVTSNQFLLVNTDNNF